MASSEHSSDRLGPPPDLRLVIDSAPALIHTSLPDGYLDFFNQSWLKYVGLSLEDLQGWAWTAAIHPEDVAGMVAKWRACLANGTIFEYEARVRRADAEYRWMSHRKVPLRDDEGNILKWYGSSIDIEDRRQAEDALKRSESYLVHAQKLTKAGSWAYKPPDICEYWSEEMFRIFGFDPSKGYPPNDEVTSLIHPADRQRAEEALTQHFKQGRVFDMKYRIVRHDGQLRVIRDFGTPVFENGVVTRFVGACLDVTEQEQTIEQLRQNEFYLAEGQRLAHMGSWAFNPSGFFDYWSRELLQIYGLDPAKRVPTLEEYLGITHPQDREFMARTIEKMVAEGLGCDVKKRIVRPDGELRYIRCVGVPVLDNGTLKSIVGTAVDITEEEQLTQELQRREAYLAEAQRLSNTGSFGWRVSTGELLWSEETFRIFQYDRATKPTVELVLHRVHPEDAGFVKQTIERASRDGKDFDFEHRLLMPDGCIKHLHVVAHAVRDESDKVEVFGSVMDVTGVKRSEQALRESEEQWRDVFENNPTMYFMVDAVGTVMAVNPFGAEQLGYNVDELVGQSVLKVFYQPDFEEVQGNFALCLKQLGKSMSWELRKVRKDGSILWVRETARAVLRTNAPVVLIACEDITERKSAEERIHEQEIELRQMLDLAPQHVFVQGPDGDRLYANQAALDYYGQTLEEWRTFDRLDGFYPGDWERMLREIQSQFLSGVPHEGEARILGRDGKYRWFLFRRNPLRDEQGRITRWYVAATDIDDRKLAEERLQHENVALREEIDKASMFEEIVGTSPVLRKVLSRVSKVAPTDSTVLITGETGTGKELVARAIHRRSHRSSRAFVSVNCAAIPRDLIASELFGHEKGAFTGATQRRLGRFELAEGGTIFLDEVGELPSETQISLLRVLQEHEFERIGGTRSIQTNVRVIAATNRDLQAAIAAGIFRNDLFYRLNVFPIEIPPLRERREDISLLVEYFIDRYARKAGKSILGVSKKTLDSLRSYPWPGNIRELQNVIERSVIVCETEDFSVDESWLLRQPLATEPKSPLELSQKLAVHEKEMIEGALRESGGRVFGPSGAAAKLGMPRSTLESKIRSLKINKNRFKTSDPSKNG
jgi:PAS domain S-box-containing protein